MNNSLWRSQKLAADVRVQETINSGLQNHLHSLQQELKKSESLTMALSETNNKLKDENLKLSTDTRLLQKDVEHMQGQHEKELARLTNEHEKELALLTNEHKLKTQELVTYHKAKVAKMQEVIDVLTKKLQAATTAPVSAGKATEEKDDASDAKETSWSKDGSWSKDSNWADTKDSSWSKDGSWDDKDSSWTATKDSSWSKDSSWDTKDSSWSNDAGWDKDGNWAATKDSSWSKDGSWDTKDSSWSKDTDRQETTAPASAGDESEQAAKKARLSPTPPATPPPRLLEQAVIFLNPRYKTELCVKWAVGTCRFNGSCHFAHGQEQLRPVP